MRSKHHARKLVHDEPDRDLGVALERAFVAVCCLCIKAFIHLLIYLFTFHILNFLVTMRFSSNIVLLAIASTSVIIDSVVAAPLTRPKTFPKRDGTSFADGFTGPVTDATNAINTAQLDLTDIASKLGKMVQAVNTANSSSDPQVNSTFNDLLLSVQTFTKDANAIGQAASEIQNTLSGDGSGDSNSDGSVNDNIANNNGTDSTNNNGVDDSSNDSDDSDPF